MWPWQEPSKLSNSTKCSWKFDRLCGEVSLCFGKQLNFKTAISSFVFLISFYYKFLCNHTQRTQYWDMEAENSKNKRNRLKIFTEFYACVHNLLILHSKIYARSAFHKTYYYSKSSYHETQWLYKSIKQKEHLVNFLIMSSLILVFK